MTRCLPLCERNQRKRKNKEKKQVRREEKLDKETLKKLVPKRFWRQKKVFGKVELEYILV